MLKSQPLLPGQSEFEQVDLICKLLGSPHSSIWPDLKKMPLYGSFKMPEHKYDSISEEFQDFSKEARDLVKSFLIYCPRRRISAHEALKHDFFFESPRACQPLQLGQAILNFV